jgi:hypothetical protein
LLQVEKKEEMNRIGFQGPTVCFFLMFISSFFAFFAPTLRKKEEMNRIGF